MSEKNEQLQFAVMHCAAAQRAIADCLVALGAVSPMASQLEVAKRLAGYQRKLANVQRDLEQLPV